MDPSLVGWGQAPPPPANPGPVSAPGNATAPVSAMDTIQTDPIGDTALAPAPVVTAPPTDVCTVGTVDMA
jgi:hypothetical protein